MTELPELVKHSPLVVPIRSLGPNHRERMVTHLAALDEHDRYLRFGYPANDEQIRRYVDSLDFERDDIFGVYNRKLELIAAAHLAFSDHPEARGCAEFGVSVLQKTRGRGLGARLFERAVMHARNRGVDMLFIHALTENTAMLNIARNAGAALERSGCETDAYLRLSPATLDSRMSEMALEQFARSDYRLKRRAKSFRDIFTGMKAVRLGMRAAPPKSAS